MTLRAVFLDRDGVLLPDEEGASPFPGAAAALASLHEHGWQLVVVTNQTAIARGILTARQVEERHRELQEHFTTQGAPIAAFLYCPHHPQATVMAYRRDCECRKPRPGLLVEAAHRFHLDLPRSVMVGDRMTDVEAGNRAGCTTILLETGRHIDPRIVTADPPMAIEPDVRLAGLPAAATWVLESRP